MSARPASFFPTPALDHAFAGIGAGTVAVLCMQPLDLLKVQFQVMTTSPASRHRGAGVLKNNPITTIYDALQTIRREHGWKGLYRGVGPNVAGNAASWGLYFWFYTMIKSGMTDTPSGQLTSAQYLLSSAEASAVTALITNPIWVVKVRMFTSAPGTPTAYRGLIHGLSEIARTEGIRGWYRGTWMALVGVTSGSVQFMAYEQMKNFAFARKKRRMLAAGETWREGEEKLSNTAYTVISATAKLVALVSTYPYQVVRSRLQNSPSITSPSPPISSSTSSPSATFAPTSSGTTLVQPPTFRSVVRQTWAKEGYHGFYRGLGTNLVRVLPATCITFVVYENMAWGLRTTAMRRDAAAISSSA
ncbi:mitochondrial carrier [Clavulina sp. PMI_390]|nr:mitochondrial carrier [Clavulina sp. PMI_390]